MKRIRHEDGAVHFSALAKMARSPLHYRAACEAQRVPTRGMRIGTATHWLVFGPREGAEIALWDGKRVGKDYEAFVQAHVGAEIITSSEWAAAVPIADAILASEPAMRLIRGARHEVPLRWTDAGIECATGGIDVLGVDYIADLKTTRDAQPDRFSRAGASYSYHGQLAFYLGGCVAAGLLLPTARAYLIAVESEAPHAVTVLEVGPSALEAGRRSITLWFERLRGCESEDSWPGYAQDVVPFEMPEWLVGDEALEEDEAAA